MTGAITHSGAVDPPPAPHTYSLATNQRFGHFLIVRPLGRGGMGEVYEAEDEDSGRRVALKLLRESLGSDTDRARFLREGRLAASINHERVVYVYGSEGIAGCPVIVMELAGGGNLKERVDSAGPLPAAQAVDAILQVIDGLEATASSGILHRDIKPSNCFFAADGSVKVGDFGLSISTRSPAESQLTVNGVVLGTPAFAPPEQIMGQPLDVRSDIYSTGATLYFLLTGKAPFAGGSVVQLIGSVLKTQPPSPSHLVPGLPPDLSGIVVRCLEKDPPHRYQSYADVRRALQPFSSQQPVYAPLHLRILASLVDEAVYSLPFLVAMPEAFESGRALLGRPEIARLVGTSISALLYFGLLEGIWGAAVGKWLLGIRVATVSHQGINPGRVLVRSFIWIAAIILVPFALAVAYEASTGNRLGEGRVLMSTIGVLLLFATARRANGYAGVHDVLTGTRVVEQPMTAARPAVHIPPRDGTIDPRAQRIGAYLVVESLGSTGSGHLVLGYDDVLRRYVWIHTQSPGAAPVPAERQTITRAGRLRWLAGRRTPLESWDAYDAPAGVPFTVLVRELQPWSVVRFLVHDVAVEVQHILTAREIFPFALERLWITQSGTAMLLDFPAPGSETLERRNLSASELIRKTASLALSGRSSPGRDARTTTAPLPLHASEFLRQVGQGKEVDFPASIAALSRLLGLPDTLTWRRRLVHLACVASVPLGVMAFALVASIRQGTFSVFTFAAPLAGVLLMLSTASIYAAAAFRGGLLFQLLGIAIATSDGRQASRTLALWRAAIAWLPSLAFVAGVVFQIPWLAVSAVIVIATAMVSALISPDRGLQDRLLGTRLVRR